jgi:hypothetical protein
MKLMLLVAEGDAELREIYRRFLTERDYEVQTAADVECSRHPDYHGRLLAPSRQAVRCQVASQALQSDRSA